MLRAASRSGAVLAALAGILAFGLMFGCASEQAARDPLAPSDAPERVLRTLRLAGVENAVVGEGRGTAIARVEVPAISSAGDVEIAWQLAVTALAEAYPRARTYSVQLFGPSATPLVEFTVPGKQARAAIDADSAVDLRAATDVRYLADGPRADGSLRDAAPEGAAPLPDDALATGTDVSGAYLDARNRAGGMAGGPSVEATRAREAAGRTRLAVPGRPAPALDEDAGLALASRLIATLGEGDAADTAGAARLRDTAGSVAAGAEPSQVLALRTWLAVVEAATAEKPFGSVIAEARSSAQSIAEEAALEPGSVQSDAILAAAQSPDAPATAKIVSRFKRAPGSDVPAQSGTTSAAVGASVDASPGTIPREVLSRSARDASVGGQPPVSWEATGGVRRQVAPAAWLAYTSGAGRLFWLAGDSGPVALTDASVPGWAWAARRAALVDAANVGHVLSTVELR